MLLRSAKIEATPNYLYCRCASYTKMRGKGRLYSDHNEQVSKGSIFLHESVIHGSHVFNEVWTQWLGEILLVSEVASNAHGRRTAPVFLGWLRP